MTGDFQPGATGWDVLLRSGDKLKQIAVVVIVLAVIWLGSQYFDTETVEAVVLGAILGWLLTSYFTRPVGRMVLVVPKDLKEDHIRLVWIPEEHYPQFNTSGNGYALTSMLGMPLYIATAIDTEARTIDYGWVHEKNIAQVYAYEEILTEFIDDCERAMVENLKISQHPRLWGARLAREPIQFMSDEYGRLAGFGECSQIENDVDIVAMAREIAASSRDSGDDPSEVFA